MQTKTITMLLGAVLSTGMLVAQTPEQGHPSTMPQGAEQGHGRPHHAANPDKQARHLGRRLGLTREQVAQIKPILEERQQKMQTLHSDSALSQQDRRAKAQGIMQDTKNKIEAVLNDSQKQQFEQLLQERHAHHTSQPQAR